MDPDLTDRGNPKGHLFNLTIPLAGSKFFPGNDSSLGPRADRLVWVYVPAAYVDGTEAPMQVLFDAPATVAGDRYVSSAMAAVDNLAAPAAAPSRRLPPVVLIAVQNGGDGGKISQRGLEYNTMSDANARFLSEEVLPAVLRDGVIRRAYPNLSFTADPSGRGVLGCSSGGAAAVTAAWFRPDLWSRVVGYSTSLVAEQMDSVPEHTAYPLGAWEYHSNMSLVAAGAKKPLRMAMHVAEFDPSSGRGSKDAYHNWQLAFTRTIGALDGKGYDYRAVTVLSAQHCDTRMFDHTLADALVWVWDGYK